MMSVKTLQSCSEDALTDTPTRERGQWLGDAVAVGMETISVVFNDLSLIRRGLVQAAYCQREDGMVAGLYPGQNTYVSS
jgi:alpha-L-rhamnosidase